jgi:hypothetical protein
MVTTERETEFFVFFGMDGDWPPSTRGLPKYSYGYLRL